MSIPARCCHPKRDDDDKDPKDVKDEYNGFRDGHADGKEDVEEHAEEDDTDSEQGFVPTKQRVNIRLCVRLVRLFDSPWLDYISWRTKCGKSQYERGLI